MNRVHMVHTDRVKVHPEDELSVTDVSEIRRAYLVYDEDPDDPNTDNEIEM